MDGSNPMAVIHSSDVTSPVSLAIDNRGASSKLFVADSAQQRIKMFNTDGKNQVSFTITDADIAGKKLLYHSSIVLVRCSLTGPPPPLNAKGQSCQTKYIVACMHLQWPVFIVPVASIYCCMRICCHPFWHFC